MPGRTAHVPYIGKVSKYLVRLPVAVLNEVESLPLKQRARKRPSYLIETSR